LKESPSTTTAGSTASEASSDAVLGPAEPVVAVRSSDSKSWIQSTFSASLFSNLGGKEDSEGDEERSPRKFRRRQKQHSSSDEHFSEGGKEKRSLWGRKKKKKKKQSKDGRFNENLTDTSMTDEDAEHTNKGRDSSSNREEERRRNNRRDIDDSETILDNDTILDDETRLDDDTRTYLDDGATLATYSSSDEIVKREGNACCDGDGMFGCISGSRALKSISNEISGACEDTLVSVDQVFNAFTLTDKDIKAVKKKIDRAKKQLDS